MSEESLEKEPINGEVESEDIGKLSDEKLLELAKKQYAQSVEMDDENRRNFESDIDFYSGDTQWDANVKKDREDQARPCLTVNRLPQFVRQVVNDFRQNKTTIKVRAADDDADVETAEIYQGLIRHIEANSNADIAYENAFFYSVTGGFGYYRVVTDYLEDSFDQDIFIKPIPNALTVRFDPCARSLDGSDWEWCFIEQEMSRKAFEKEYPDIDTGSWDDTYTHNWATKDSVKVAEYFYYEYKEEKLLRFEDGVTMYESEFKKIKEANPSANYPSISDERMAERKFVKWAKLAGNSVLERKDWAGKYIPVIPVFGDTIEIKGERKYISLIRFAKDAQRMLNYYRSTETELLALQPKAPFIIAEGQIEGYEDEWGNANRIAYSALTYKPTTIDGMAVPAPQRQGFASPPSGVLQGALNAEQDMMNTTGIHESGLGMKSNESSGKAILARQREGDISTFHFIDNMARSQRQCGRVLVDLIPKIYDTPRVIRILGDDDSEHMKVINQPTTEKDKYGQEIQKIYDLSVGTYDVVVSSGASYTTRRQEAAEAMMSIGQANPALWQFAPDLMVKAMDWPDADSLAERLKKTLPPGLAEPEEDEEAPQIPMEIQQQLEQMQQQIQQAEAAMNEMQQALESKDYEMQVKDRELSIKEQEVQIKAALAQAEIVSKQSVQPDSRNDELSDAEAERINHESEMKALLANQEFEHKKELMILQAKLERLKEADLTEMDDIDERGEIKPSEMSCNMQNMQNQIAELTGTIAAMVAKQNAPKVIIRDENGRPIGIETV